MHHERNDRLIWESHTTGPSILVFDDSQSRQTDLIKFLPKFSSAYNKQDMLAIIATRPWDVVFLDHDLEGSNTMEIEDENSGSSMAHTMVHNADKLNIKLIVCHSNNRDGRENMVRILSPHFNAIDAAYMQPAFIQVVQQLRRAS